MAGMGRAGAPVATRFWAKVNKTETCWLWTAFMYPSGYGYFRWSTQRRTVAHKAAWELTHGPVPANLQVLHRCDVRNCVRPDHLFLGTQQDNLDDMKAKGRSPQGNQRPNAKLNSNAVQEIRTRVAAGESLCSIAPSYGVHATTARQALLGLKWKHVQ